MYKKVTIFISTVLLIIAFVTIRHMTLLGSILFIVGILGNIFSIFFLDKGKEKDVDIVYTKIKNKDLLVDNIVKKLEKENEKLYYLFDEFTKVIRDFRTSIEEMTNLSKVVKQTANESSLLSQNLIDINNFIVEGAQKQAMDAENVTKDLIELSNSFDRMFNNINEIEDEINKLKEKSNKGISNISVSMKESEEMQTAFSKAIQTEQALKNSVDNAYKIISSIDSLAERINLVSLNAAIEAAKHRYSTYFINFYDLMSQLKKALLENRLEIRLKHFAKYKVLVIDEIGYLPIDNDSSNLFFQLISERYEKHSTIITTNTPFSDWQEIFGTPMLAQAILDRLLHHSHVISIKGKSYRLKEKLDLFSNVVNS